MEIIAFMLTAGQSISWLADRDLVYRGAYSSNPAADASIQVSAVNSDLVPSTTIAPAAKVIRTDILFTSAKSSSSLTARNFPFPLDVPILKGTTLIVQSTTAASSVLMMVDEAQQAAVT